MGHHLRVSTGVAVAKRLTRRAVTPATVGLNPTGHPCGYSTTRIGSRRRQASSRKLRSNYPGSPKDAVLQKHDSALRYPLPRGRRLAASIRNSKIMTPWPNRTGHPSTKRETGSSNLPGGPIFAFVAQSGERRLVRSEVTSSKLVGGASFRLLPGTAEAGTFHRIDNVRFPPARE